LTSCGGCSAVDLEPVERKDSGTESIDEARDETLCLPPVLPDPFNVEPDSTESAAPRFFLLNPLNALDKDVWLVFSLRWRRMWGTCKWAVFDRPF
jgi:hypothetical protein